MKEAILKGLRVDLLPAGYSELFTQLTLAGAFDQLEVFDSAELVSDDEWEELSDFLITGRRQR